VSTSIDFLLQEALHVAVDLALELRGSFATAALALLLRAAARLPAAGADAGATEELRLGVG